MIQASESGEVLGGDGGGELLRQETIGVGGIADYEDLYDGVGISI